MTDVSIEDIEKAITTLNELETHFDNILFPKAHATVVRELKKELERRKKPTRSIAVLDASQKLAVYVLKPNGSTLGVYINSDGSYETLDLKGPNTFYGNEVWSNR